MHSQLYLGKTLSMSKCIRSVETHLSHVTGESTSSSSTDKQERGGLNCAVPAFTHSGIIKITGEHAGVLFLVYFK